MNRGMIPPGHIAVNEKEYKDLSKQVGSLQKKVEEQREELVNLPGVNAPPCVFSNGRQTFFEVIFLPGKNYHLKFKNIDNTMRFGKWSVKRNQDLILSHKEFIKFANSVVKSTRINEDDPRCCCGAPARNISSEYCTECMYVFFHKEAERKKWNFKKSVDGPTAISMLKTVEKYFLRTDLGN